MEVSLKPHDLKDRWQRIAPELSAKADYYFFVMNINMPQLADLFLFYGVPLVSACSAGTQRRVSNVEAVDRKMLGRCAPLESNAGMAEIRDVEVHAKHHDIAWRRARHAIPAMFNLAT
jgi:hypothetical protein